MLGDATDHLPLAHQDADKNTQPDAATKRHVNEATEASLVALAEAAKQRGLTVGGHPTELAKPSHADDTGGT